MPDCSNNVFLVQIEETVLESLAWKKDSPLWDAIQQNSDDIPMCEEVSVAVHRQIIYQ